MSSIPAASKLVVMSFHPVTKGFSEQIARICGPISSFYDAANLRKLGPVASIRDLLGVRADTLVIALEGEAGRVLIGPLSIAAAFTRAKAIRVIWPDLRVETVGRIRALRTAVQAAYDTLMSRRALGRSAFAVAELRKLAMPRVVAPSQGSRVLYLDANISLGTAIGGSIGHTAGVIDGLVQHGYQVEYASLKAIPTQRQGATALKLQQGSMLAMPPELNFYRHAEQIESTIPPLHQAKPWSFIYQRFSQHNFTGPRLGRQLNIPVVVEFNGSEAWLAENWGARLALHDAALITESAALENADLLVTVSDELGHDLKRRGIPDERIVVYPNCVDPDYFDSARFGADELAALRKRYEIPQDALVIGFIGTFGQWHGVEFLAECIRDMIRDDLDWIVQNKIHFVLVGDGLKMPNVRQLVGSAPEQRHVTLTGLVPQSQAAAYLASMDVLVSPHVPNADGSQFFGSPTKLFEYMSMQKPIIAAALGQIADVVAGRAATRLGSMPPGAGEMCGYLYEPGNAAEFKKVLRDVIADKPAAAKVAKAARAEVLNRYTWKRHVDAVLDRMAANGLLSRSSDNSIA